MPSRRQDTQPCTDGAAATPQAARNKLRLLDLPASGQEGLLLCTGTRKDPTQGQQLTAGLVSLQVYVARGKNSSPPSIPPKGQFI